MISYHVCSADICARGKLFAANQAEIGHVFTVSIVMPLAYTVLPLRSQLSIIVNLYLTGPAVLCLSKSQSIVLFRSFCLGLDVESALYNVSKT